MSQTKSGSIHLSGAEPASAEDKKKARLLALAGAAGFLGSVCCVGPLVAVSLGLGGAVVAAMVGFAPYQPVFISVALGALGYAGWKIYRKPAQPCASGEVCGLPATNRVYKIVWWAVAALVLALLTAPYYAPLFY